MPLDLVHQLAVTMCIMRKSTDLCGGVNGCVRNLCMCVEAVAGEIFLNHFDLEISQHLLCACTI